MCIEKYQELGRRLRLVRQSSRIKLQEIADALGVSFQQIQKYEKGTNRIPVLKLLMFCRKANVSMDILLSDLEGSRPFDIMMAVSHFSLERPVSPKKENIKTYKEIIDTYESLSNPDLQHFIVDHLRSVARLTVKPD